MQWTCLHSEQLVDNRWVKVRKDQVQLPNGMVIDDFYAVTISEAAAVVAVTKNQEIILKKEYRYTYDKELIEIPAGTFEPEETDSLAVAKRELLEETGYTSEEWTYMGATVESSSKLTNHMHIYLAVNCRKVAGQKLDAAEDIDVMLVPIERAVDMVMTNEICCCSSAHGILKAARMLEKSHSSGRFEL